MIVRLRSCLAATLVLVCGATDLRAQDRLVGLRALSGGGVFEQVRFGDTGLLQTPLVGQDSLRITSATQLTFPVSAAMPLGERWTMDITTVFATGEVGFTPAAGGAERTASLSGLSDVRVRTSGRFFDDAIILTIGVNAPTGKTQLDSLELTALRVLAAPALAMGAAPVGAGPSGVVGLLSARTIGPWAAALGVSYEYRGTYQPVAALAAGAPSADFQPGGAVRVSLGLDRLLGSHRLTLATAADIYRPDELRGPSGNLALAQVKLGPVLSADAQLLLGVPRLRELMLWSAVRYRSNFSRDGITVENTSGAYLDGGVRTSVPIAAATDIVLAANGRFHTGLAIDEGLPTSGVTSGTVTIGLSQRAGSLVFQPFARATSGSVNARGSARDLQQASFTGFTGGLVIISRF